ncbi:MAG: WxcM-like domain-containing protein [Muribaculaceae bacterium]|nr:WxcM-like domain-containing protein [Muribaculaceae bacterium]
MEKIHIIKGEIFEDFRGRINSINNFHFEGIKRCYLIHHPDSSIIRGWHGHQNERKWFYCVKGDFKIALVKIDDWNNPSNELKPHIYDINDKDSQLICVPSGYANCIKTNTDGSILLVLSDKTLEEAVEDSWRYDKSMWVDWSKL